MRGATLCGDVQGGTPAGFQSTHPLRGATVSTTIRKTSLSHFNPRTPCGVRRLYPHADCAGRDFNPRTPCGVRPQARKWYNWLIEFQSTHPLRGATGITHKSGEHIKHFNPRTPCGVRHNSGSRPARRGNFNPRTPCGVRLCAPSVRLPVRSYFNPRTPCGVRLQPCFCIFKLFAFQSTHPLRGATPFVWIKLHFNRFQSTHPLRGATQP